MEICSADTLARQLEYFERKIQEILAYPIFTEDGEVISFADFKEKFADFKEKNDETRS